jgi:hypothetical protein
LISGGGETSRGSLVCSNLDFNSALERNFLAAAAVAAAADKIAEK